jgi:hypothetical protein
MKRMLASFVVLVLCANASFAAESPSMFTTGSFSIGPYAGFTYGAVAPEPSVDGMKWALGAAAGLDARYYLCETSNLQLGARFERRASKQTLSDAFATYEASEKRNYLMFDLTAAWYVANIGDGAFRPRIYGGVFLGSFLSGTMTRTSTFTGGTPRISESDITTDEIKQVTWGPKIGIGFDWKMGSGALTFGVSYDHGLSNLAGDAVDSDYKGYDRGISAGLGFQFGL